MIDVDGMEKMLVTSSEVGSNSYCGSSNIILNIFIIYTSHTYP